MPIKDYVCEIYLASQSPARLGLLREQGLEVHACPQFCEEKTTETHPGKVVESLSMQKLESFMKNSNFKADCTAIACDTLLYFKGKLIGKAHSAEEAEKQISQLAGNTHQVYSGYSLYYKGSVYHGYDCADVTFTPISDEDIEKYIESNEWKGAAGSYHIFGKAVDFIEKVEGDINTVIGLPLKTVEKLIEDLENKV